MHVGTLAALWRYPVKSMRAEALTEAEVGWYGVEGDRRWAFIRPGVERSGFPWLTLRELAEMWRFRPYFANPDRPDASQTIVRTPNGEEYDVADRALAKLLGDGVRIIKQDRGVFDSMPLSLISTRTVEGLQHLTGRHLEWQRFRANLLVEVVGDIPFPEESWVGSILRIGTMRMRVDRRDQRCAILTTDPNTGGRDPAILRHIARQRDGCAGVYGSTVTPGRVALGDAVVLEPARLGSNVETFGAETRKPERPPINKARHA
jgi:MOSC domain-containing protein